MTIEKLKAPFTKEQLEWRPQQQGVTKGKPWCMVLCYVSARAIQDRLDKVFGYDGWQVEYRTGNNDNNIICRLTVKTENGWIYKEDGASETQVEPFKGGISSALKRCASSGYGIGRYLYDLDVTFAECSTERQNGKEWNKSYHKETKTNYWWKTPDINNLSKPVKNINKEQQKQEPTNEELDKEVTKTTGTKCPKCGEKATQGALENWNMCLECKNKENK